MATERIITIPESLAVIIRKEFLPANPARLRWRRGWPLTRLPQVQRAVRDFINAIDNARDPS